MIKNTINEGYEKNRNLFTSSIGSKVFIKKKKFIDLSMCAGSILLAIIILYTERQLKNV